VPPGKGYTGALVYKSLNFLPILAYHSLTNRLYGHHKQVLLDELASAFALACSRGTSLLALGTQTGKQERRFLPPQRMGWVSKLRF